MYALISCFRYDVTKTEGVTFSWAYQKVSWSDNGMYMASSKYRNDRAKIYSISVSNTIKGGASKCKTCPKGADMEG